jgi:uncharacterized damage-inducible protein DinB
MSVETFLQQLNLSSFVLKANLEGITQAESLIQPSPAGNCVNWVLGHLVATRSNLLRMLGGEPFWDEATCARYDRNAEPLRDAKDARPIDEIRAGLETTAQRLRAAAGGLTPEQLAAKAPMSPTGNPEETIGSLLTVFGFHDAYHAGQTGLLRRIVGQQPAGL